MNSKHRGKQSSQHIMLLHVKAVHNMTQEQRGEREGGRDVIDDGGRKEEGSEGKEGRRDGRK